VGKKWATSLALFFKIVYNINSRIEIIVLIFKAKGASKLLVWMLDRQLANAIWNSETISLPIP
jgi:hypothetical protein